MAYDDRRRRIVHDRSDSAVFWEASKAAEPRGLAAAAVVAASQPDARRRTARVYRFTEAREPSLSLRAGTLVPPRGRLPVRAGCRIDARAADARRTMKAGLAVAGAASPTCSLF
jgi:hypothetical protein